MNNFIFKILSILITLLLPTIGSSFVVENTAKATYSVKDEHYSVYSNSSKVIIEDNKQDDKTIIEFFKYSSSSDKYISIPQSDYSLSLDANSKFNKMTPLVLDDGTKIDFNQKFPVMSCLVYSKKDPIIVAVHTNLYKDTLLVKIGNGDKDKEIIKLKESSFGSGLFLGLIKTTTKKSQNISCDGKLYVYEGADITVSIQNSSKKRINRAQVSKTISIKYTQSSKKLKQTARENKKLWISNTPLKHSVYMGEKILYRVDIKNSDFKVDDFDVVLKIPKGVKVISSDINGIFSKNHIYFNISSLQKREKFSFEYLVDSGIFKKKRLGISAWLEKNGKTISNRVFSTIEIKSALNQNKAFIYGKIVDWKKKPLKGVKIYLENGMYVITDENGKYHFEGLNIGTHIVQVDLDSLDVKYKMDKFSKFVEFFHGGIKNINFTAQKQSKKKRKKQELKKSYDYKTKVKKSSHMPQYTTKDIKNSKTDLQFLWPKKDFLPSVPSIKIAILHPKDDKLELFINGESVSMLNYDGQIKDGQKAISTYRGVDILEGDNELMAKLVSKSGKVRKVLKRNVHFSSSPIKAEVVKELSYLVADGKTSPTIAVRFYDESGYKIREDVQGVFNVDAPYRALQELEEMKKNPLINSNQKNKFVIYGDGVAFIKLEPTTKSGDVKLHFNFKDLDEVVSAWLSPSSRDWVIVGFSEGSAGYKQIKNSLKKMKNDSYEVYKNKRISFFAKGVITGDILLSMAYDSGKSKDLSLFEKIEPNEFYTIYADNSDQLYEAQSQKKLYVKIEKDKFYALFGDIQTSLSVTELSKYNRVFNGIKSQYSGDNLSYSAFVAKSKNLFVKDEIRGDGTSGKYFLKHQNIIKNSQKITIETRDRYREEIILSSKSMSCYVNYNIDYEEGSIYFKNPIFSQDENGNLVYIVVDYEIEGDKKEHYTYGGRVAVSSKDKKYELGATYIKEDQTQVNKTLMGLDAKLKVNNKLEIKSEFAKTKENSTSIEGKAYLAEIIYRESKYNIRAYFREQDGVFGLDQQNSSLKHTRKYGVDAKINYFKRVALRFAGYRDVSLLTNSYKDVGEFIGNYTTNTINIQLGLRANRDNTSDNLQLIGGVSKFYFNKRLKLGVQKEYLLKGENVIFPDKTRYEASYALNSNISVFTNYETLNSNDNQKYTLRAGVSTRLWKGATLNSDIAQEFKNDNKRVFASYAMKQNYKVSKELQLSGGIESKKSVKSKLKNSDDYSSYYIGANYHKDQWSINSKVEFKDTKVDDKINLDLGVYNDINETLGLAFGIRANSIYGEKSDKKDFLSYLSVAYRPKAKWMFLNKLNVLYSIEDNLESKKIINNLLFYINFYNNFDLSLQYGLKYIQESINKKTYESVIDLLGVDLDYKINKKLNLGLHTSLLHAYSTSSLEYSLGSNIGYSLFENSLITVGYNIDGFYDEDLKSKNSNEDGFYIDYKMKFNQYDLNTILTKIIQ